MFLKYLHKRLKKLHSFPEAAMVRLEQVVENGYRLETIP